jgi:uncharacterized protein
MELTMPTRVSFVKLSQSPPAFHLLAKPTGAICNLRCQYCFFLEKEKLYPGSKFSMTDRVLQTYIRQLIEAHRTQEINVAWQGGEPTLMGLEFFKRSIRYEKKFARPGNTFLNTIQTNGTLLNDEWAAFFKKNNFLVGISIDGPPDIHDRYRRDRGGAPTFDRVRRGLSYLQKHNVDWNALTTIHRGSAGRGAEVYRFLRDECKAEFIQFIPIVEKDNREGKGPLVSDRSIGAEEFGQFLIDVFEEWLKSDVARVYVQMLDVALANWYGEPPLVCVFSERCGTALALEHNGDVYSCDHFVEPAYRLGNIQAQHLIELVACDRQAAFGRDKYEKLPDYCRNCEVLFACHGGCPKDRFELTPDGQPGLNYLCRGYKLFFKHIDRTMKEMVDLLKQKRSPAEIMKARPAGQSKN